MIGRIHPSYREATVVGGGIAGMLAAYFLDEAGFVVTLLERADRLGGLISTQETEFGISESAAHTLLGSPEVLQLLGKLGLAPVEVHPQSKARYILRDGKMRRLPLRFSEAVSLAQHALFSRAENTPSSPNVEDWCRRHLGTAALDYLVSPFLLGIYGARASALSLEAIFPKLKVPPGQTLFGSLWRQRSRERSPKPKILSLPKGMGQFTRTLADQLESRLGNRLRLGENITAVPDAPNLVLAVPSFEAARLLKKESPGLSEALSKVDYVPLVSCTAFLKRSAHRVPQGIGVLIPERERRGILGVLFNSSAFPGRVKDEADCSYTVMLGGSLRPELVDQPDGILRQLVSEELARLFDASGEPVHLVFHRWKAAIPKYSGSLQETWEQARRTWALSPGRILFGNYSGQVSLRGMVGAATLIGHPTGSADGPRRTA